MSDQIVTLTSIDSDFCERLVDDLMRTELNTGSARASVKQADDAPEWAESTDYGETFRALVIDEEAAGVPVPADLVEAARRISGRREVVAFRAQANAMVAGTGLGRHTDVPEFWGARRYVFPDWLLVTMLHAGLWDDERIDVVSALVFPMETNGGDLCVYDRSDRSHVASFAPVPATAVVFDTCCLPHRVDAIPGNEIATARGDHIVLRADSWRMHRSDGSKTDLSRHDVRTSVLVKLACFDDAAERDRWFAATEPAKQPGEVFAALADRLPEVADDGRALPQQLVDHFIPYR